MTRRERNIRRIIFFIILALVVVLICGCVKKSAADFEMYETYVINSGDTLWGIAEEYKPAGMGYREYIYKLREHNGIGADIYPGQAIEVLIF